MLSKDIIKLTSNHIRTASHIAVLTGAGVSKESDVPTFRDAQEGLWAQYDPTQLATRQAFSNNPKLVWDFYEFRRDIMRPANPNPGHYALAELQKLYPSLRIITQNVDDLHERAGSTEVIRLHGNIATNKCFHDCKGDPTPVDVSQITWDKTSGPPPCPHCGRWVRPAVVWFGEMLPKDALYKAQDVLTRADLMLVIGTSGLVSPAADMPRIVKLNRGKIIEINPDDTPISVMADVKINAPSGEALPLIVQALKENAT